MITVNFERSHSNDTEKIADQTKELDEIKLSVPCNPASAANAS